MAEWVRRRRRPALTSGEQELEPPRADRAARRRLRGRWQEVQRLRVASYDWGGVSVTSFEWGEVTDRPTRAPEGTPLLARSVIQPDGDVLFFVAEDVVATDVHAHISTVQQWYQDAAGILRTTVASLLVVRWTVAGVLAVSSSSWTAAWSDWWSTAFAVVVAGVMLPALRWVIGQLVRWGLRSRMLL